MIEKQLEGYLEDDNYGRWTTYKVKLLDDRKVDTSDRKVDTSDRKVDTSDRKVDTSNRKVATSKRAIRLPKFELEKLIMELCAEDYRKMNYVAQEIGKSEDYLKNKIFPQMIKEGKLEKKYPFKHNHPNQAYKTTEEYAKQL